MKHVGKRKVLISAVAMLLTLVFTGAAFAGSHPSPAFFLPSVNSRPEATATPEVTATPEASTVPEETASPEATAAPEETVDPEATPTPEATVEPEATTAPEATTTPEETEAPEATPVPEGSPEPSVTPVPAAEATIAYQRDEAGNLILDENGNPVAIIAEGMAEIPVQFQRDESGALVLDENGNPIPIATIPTNAQKIETLEDKLNPNRTVDIYADWGGGTLYFGDEATLVAVLKGYDNAVYTLQWQQSTDNATWNDIGGENGDRMQVVVTEKNYTNYWRVLVTITDVVEAE